MGMNKTCQDVILERTRLLSVQNRRGNDHSLKQCLISVSGTNRHWYSSSTETKIRAVLHNKKLRETKLFEYVDIPKWSFATVCSYKNRILTQKYKEQSITYCKQPADFTRSSTPFSILFSRNIWEQVRDNWKKSGNKQEKKSKKEKRNCKILGVSSMDWGWQKAVRSNRSAKLGPWFVLDSYRFISMKLLL